VGKRPGSIVPATGGRCRRLALGLALAALAIAAGVSSGLADGDDSGGSGRGARARRARPAAAAGGGGLRYELFLREAHRSLHAADYFRARDHFARAADLDLTAAEARFGLADALAALGQYHSAAEQLGYGIRLDPGWPDRDYPRYGSFGDARSFDRIIARMRAAVADLPDDGAVRLVLAYNLFHLGNLADAYGLFGEARDQVKGHPLPDRYLKAIEARGYTPPKVVTGDEPGPPKAAGRPTAKPAGSAPPAGR
jgi:tetratricopeptide (TPR) repeat protein